MGRQTFTNHAFSTLAAGIIASDLSLAVQAGDGALFPAISGADWFVCTLVNASNQKEIIKVTARSTDTFTIVRAQEGTLARAYSSGDRVVMRLTAGGIMMNGVQVVNSIAELKALIGLGFPTTVLVLGYTSAGDGGGGHYWWNSADTTADNGGTVIQLDGGGTGRFNKLF